MRILIIATVGLLTGGVIVSKYYFRSFLSLKRFLCSSGYACASCSITATSTFLLTQLRLNTLSEKYRITALLVSIVGTIGYRYQLYCNTVNLMSYNVFWEYFYPWIKFCFFPSIFICGYRNEKHMITLEWSFAISIIGMCIGIFLPEYSLELNNYNEKFKKVISEYTSILISGMGCGLIVTDLLLALLFIESKLLPSLDLFSLGLVLKMFSFIIEDTRVLKEKSENTDEENEFDALLTSFPLYIDFIFIFIFLTQFIGAMKTNYKDTPTS